MKFRSKVNYGQVYAGDKQGFNLGLDSSVFVRKETTPRVFAAPRIGTQGKSVSGTTPSEDISAGPGTTFKANVHGRGALDVTLTVAGLTTGTLIAAAIEAGINAALLAAGFDERVWAQFAGGKYEIYDQATGTASAVVITDGGTDNVADDLKLGIANGGTETAGTDDQDFLLITTGGPKFEQPIETNAHRSGRFHSGIIKKKMMAEYDLETYVNMNGSAGASIDAAVRLLFESAFGTETASGVSIDYTQGLPSFYFSMARVSTIFGEYYTGCYEKELGLTFPGDGPATVKHTGKACKAAIAGLAKVAAPGATASATVPVTTDEENRFSADGRVMVVDTDGRTILAGADGSLSVVSTSDLGNTVTLSGPVTVGMGGFLAPWHPGAVQQTGRDNVFTDLVGSMKLRQGGASIDVTNISLTMANDPVDLDNIYGKDANAGAVYGNRATMTLSVTFNLSNENFAEVVLARKFEGLAPEIILGDASGRHLRIRAPKWMPAVPAIEVPENGTTPVTLEGILYESAPGQRDPITVSFR
jgi:hypothetical protein